MIPSLQSDFQSTQKCLYKIIADANKIYSTIHNQESIQITNQEQTNILITQMITIIVQLLNNLQKRFDNFKIIFDHITQTLSENLNELNEIMKNPNGNILKDNLLQQIQEYYDYQEKNNFVSLENKFGLGLYQGNKLLNTFEILDTEIIYQSDHQIFFKMFKQEIELLINQRYEQAHIILEQRIIKIKKLLSYSQYFKSLSLRELNKPGEGTQLKQKAIKNNVHLLENLFLETDQFIKNNNSNKFMDLFFQCLTLEDQSEFQVAIQICDQILQIDQQNIQALYKKAKFLENQNQKDEALQLIDDVLKINPNYVLALNLKGEILQSKSCFEESIKYFVKAYELDNLFFTALYNKCDCLQDLENYEEAVRCYDQLIKIDSKNYLAHYYKSIALTELQRYTESLSSYDKTIFLNPNYIPAYYNKGIVLNFLKKSNEAIDCFDKVISVEPNHAKSYLNKGYSLCDLGQFNEALYNYDKAISINSQFIEAYYNKGILLDDLKKFEEAIKCYDEVIKLDPNDSQSYYNKAISLQNLKKDDEALKCYDQAIQLNMSYANAYNNKGLLLEKLGKKKLAIQNYKTAMKKCSIDQNIFSKRIKRLKNKQ